MTPCALHHEQAGPVDGPVVLFTGSLGTRLSMWEPQVQALGGRFRVIRCDLRGHGGSPAPPGPYSIAQLGGDLLALLDALQLQRVDLCGLSIGAMMSLWVAAHAPDRVRRLAVCCTTARFAAEPAAAYLHRARVVRAEGLEGIADTVLGRWFTPDYTARRPDVVSRIRSDLIGVSREGYAGCCEALAALDLTPDLGRIAAPALVIAGEHDQATPPAYAEAIAAAIPDARLHRVDAAHLANLEAAPRVNALLEEFLSGA